METGSGSGPDDLTHFRQLIEDPTRYHLFHALRVIEARYRDAPRLGESRTAAQDRVRLGQVPELAFPATTLTTFQPESDGKPARLSNLFFGLWGPHGPLPLHMTEYARDRLRNHRDPTLVAFADMLTHRVMSLLYRVWASAQPAPAFDRAWQSLADDAQALLRQIDADFFADADADPAARAQAADASGAQSGEDRLGQVGGDWQAPPAGPTPAPLIPEDAFDDWALPQAASADAPLTNASTAEILPDLASLPVTDPAQTEDEDFERTVILPRGRAAQSAENALGAQRQAQPEQGPAGFEAPIAAPREDPFSEEDSLTGQDGMRAAPAASAIPPEDERTVIPFPRSAQRSAAQAPAGGAKLEVRRDPFAADTTPSISSDPSRFGSAEPGGVQTSNSAGLISQDASPISHGLISAAIFAQDQAQASQATDPQGAALRIAEDSVQRTSQGEGSDEAAGTDADDRASQRGAFPAPDPFAPVPSNRLAERRLADPTLYAPVSSPSPLTATAPFSALPDAADAHQAYRAESSKTDAAEQGSVSAQPEAAVGLHEDGTDQRHEEGTDQRYAASGIDAGRGASAVESGGADPISAFDALLEPSAKGAEATSAAGGRAFDATIAGAPSDGGDDASQDGAETLGDAAKAGAAPATGQHASGPAPRPGGDVADVLPQVLKSFTFKLQPRPKRAGHMDLSKDSLQQKVAALSGFANSAMLGADAMPDLSKRYFAGLLSSGPKNAEGLRAILEHFFEAKFTLQQFVGQWLTLEADDTWQLGRTALGRGTSLGRKVWSRDSKFRIQIGPLDLKDYQRLLPGRGAIERMEAIVRNYVGDRLAWDVQLILKAEQVPKAKLGMNVGLGYNSWMGGRIGTLRDADDLILTPPSQTKAARALAGH